MTSNRKLPEPVQADALTMKRIANDTVNETVNS